MQEITHNIALNLSQPNNFEYIHIMQGDYNAEKVIATLFDGNKLYTIDAQKASLQGSTSDGGLILQDGITISADKHQVTFEITKEMSSCTGELTCNIVLSSDNQKKSTFPFIIKNTADITGRTPVSVLTTISDYVDRAEKAASDAEKTLNDKADKDHKHTKSDITDFPILGTASTKDVAASGNASTSQVVMGNDTRLSDARKASDVHDWAKAATKPTYTASEVGAYTKTEIDTKLNDKANSSHTHGNGDITSLDASKITSGTIDIDRLPQGALDRLIKVADDTARFKLTTKDVQLGDSVKVTSTKKMYIVIDETKLSSEAGYEPYTADSATSVPWSGVTGKPSTYTPSSHTQAYTSSECTAYDSDENTMGCTPAAVRKAVGLFEPKGHTHVMENVSDWGTYVYNAQEDRTKNTVLAAPNGSNGKAIFRTLVEDDIPTLSKSKVGLENVDNTADSAKNVKTSTKLQTYKQGSTTETYGESYPIYAQWRDGTHIKMKCDGYTVETDYATTSGSADSASKATRVVDYGSTGKTIQIGYGGDGISGDAIKFIAGYTTGDGSSVARIKDISKDNLKSWLGLGSLAYSSATIPTIPSSLPANGGTSTYANYVYATSHQGSWYQNSQWDGTYFQTNFKYGDSVLPMKVQRSYSADAADYAGLLSYQHTNEINFKGGEQQTCYFNYRNADTDASGASTNIDYRFCNYAGITSKTTITAGTFDGNATSATKADYITGFSKANSDQTWGNQTGTFIAGMDDSTGGSIAFRRDNPSSGKLSVIIDGNFYQNEGKYACLDTNNYSSYALPLSGGTITGTLGVRTRLSTPLIGGTTAAEQIKITTYSNHSLEFYPYTDNRSNCGLSSYKWYAVWSYAYNGASDRKLKTNIKDIDVKWADAFIDGLKPSTYNFKKNTFGKTHTGFIAQDVEDLILSLGMDRKEFAGLVKTLKHQQTGAETYIESITDPDNFEGDDENYDYSLRYDDFIAPLVAYCQNLKKKNTDLEDKYNELTSTVNEILKKLN